MAIVFLDRLCTNGLTLHYGNWRPVLLSVSMVACKTYDDKAVYNNDFIDCQRGLTPTLLTRLEQHLLQVLDFKVNLKVSDYLRYFFELKHLQGMSASRQLRKINSQALPHIMPTLCSYKTNGREQKKELNEHPEAAIRRRRAKMTPIQLHPIR